MFLGNIKHFFKKRERQSKPSEKVNSYLLICPTCGYTTGEKYGNR